MRTISKFILSGLLAAGTASALAGNSPANFEQVYQLLRSNLDVSKSQLDSNAINGLIAEFPGRVMLVKGAATNSAGGAVVKSAIYDGSYAYIRIGNVEGTVAQQLRSAWDTMQQTNKVPLKGLILDLRFAGGSDYQAASATADCFLNSDQPLLDWGAGPSRATLKTNAITAPVAILVNSRTTGAAEALAAAMREGNAGLILGSSTAGQASLYKDFPLDNGGVLRIATAQVKLGNGAALAAVQPDIPVSSDLADERNYLTDPYQDLHPAAAGQSATNASSNLRRPTNEAELVREHRAGENADDNGESDPLNDATISAPPPPPVIKDPVLARALDLLKGVAVLQGSHSG